MSDQNEIVELANEYRRLQRQLESKTAQLNGLLEVNAPAGDFPTDFAGIQYRRYSIDFQFEPGDLQPQERSVTVETGMIFRCAYVESFLRAVGTAEDSYSGEDVSVQVTLPWNIRLNLFDYFWRVRDTGTDREWMDQPLPSLFGGGGYTGPLWLPRRTILGGGSVIFSTVEPFRSEMNQSASGFFADGTIQQYVLQISFVGHEVPDGSAL